MASDEGYIYRYHVPMEAGDGDFSDPVFVSSAEIREVSGGTVPPPIEDES
jgi:hypothetical protein